MPSKHVAGPRRRRQSTIVRICTRLRGFVAGHAGSMPALSKTSLRQILGALRARGGGERRARPGRRCGRRTPRVLVAHLASGDARGGAHEQLGLLAISTGLDTRRQREPFVVHAKGGPGVANRLRPFTCRDPCESTRRRLDVETRWGHVGPTVGTHRGQPFPCAPGVRQVDLLRSSSPRPPPSRNGKRYRVEFAVPPGPSKVAAPLAMVRLRMVARSMNDVTC